MPPKRQILKDFDLDEISSVDRPAQPTALATIIKRNMDNMSVDTAAKTISTIVKRHIYDGSAQTFSQVLLDAKIRENMWPLSDAFRTSIRSIVNDAALDQTAKGLRIDEAAAAYAGKLKELLGGAPAVMKFAEDLSRQIQETNLVSDEALKKLNERLEKLEAENKHNAALAKMNDAEKAFMSEMDDDAKKAFMSLSEDERKKKMTKRADETVTIGNQTVSKADLGDAAFSILKAQQSVITKQAEAITKAQEAAEMATLRKRADDEFGKVAGTTEERAKVLKAISSMEESVQKSMEAILKSAQSMASKGFDSQGVGSAKFIDENTPIAKLDRLAKKHAEVNKCDYHTAYSEVILKHADLYEQSLNESS